MTSNPQGRRPNPVELPPNPTLSPSITSFINQRIRQHELHVALISSLIGIPILSYILVQLHYIKSHLGIR